MDDTTAYITYVEKDQHDVFYIEVEQSTASDLVSLFHTDGKIKIALMQRDPTGDLHVAINLDAYDDRLVSVRSAMAEGMSYLTDITSGAGPRDAFEFAPAAGGFVLSNLGKLALPYQRTTSGGVSVETAWRR